VSTLKSSSITTSSSNLAAQSTNNLSKPSYRSNERPLRERVVHFLGLKPYSRSELLLKLSKDGITDKEKESLDSLIQSVGILNAKSQQYELQNEILLGELKDDWAYYSSAEKQLAKRAISNAKSVKSLGSKQSAFVPFNSIQRESPAPPQIAQSSTLLEDFGLSTKPKDTTKSKKISPKLNNETPFRPIGSTSSSSTSSSVSSSSSSLKTSPKILSSTQSNLRVASTTPPAQQAPLQQIINVSPPLKQQQQSLTRKQDLNETTVKQQNNRHSKENAHKDESKLNAELNIFYKKYSKITNDEQRSNYKKDFEALYDEYFELHNYIDSINAIFIKYQQEIQNLTKNSEDYEVSLTVI
jgi:RNA polymerase II elongation factor ELL